jgi:hypothetical protein
MSTTVTDEMKKEIQDAVSKTQQENESKMDEMKEMIQQMKLMMHQMISTAKTTENKDSEAGRDRLSVRRSLNMNHIPEMTSPVTAAKQSIGLTSLDSTPTLRHQHPQQIATLDLPHPSHTSSMNESVRSSLRKGMAKPPTFEGNVDDNILTWWRQMKNYASMFDEESQSSLIKSYLRGPAALWMDMRERELGREMTLEELADGLVQEYGSETTSQAALQKLETLSMANDGCQTLSEYHAVFAKYYNQLNVRDQAYAVRCYIKGIAPKYLKYVVFSDTNFGTLAEAKAAVTLAVAKHDQLELAYANYNQQKGRRDTKTSKQQYRKPSTGVNHHNSTNGSHNSNNNHDNNNSAKRMDSNNGNSSRRWETNNPYRVTLSSLSDTSIDGEDEGTSGEGDGERKEGQIAAVTSSHHGNRFGNNRGLRLSTDQIDMLRRERRCFKCHQQGHRISECSNATATKLPISLKQSAPSRRI